MISASERSYNRDIWIHFLEKCETRGVPFELVIYHEDMTNDTVRNSQNLVSRFRPFPDIFGHVLPLRNAHGSINFTQIYLKMLEYGCKVPHAARCIVLTERTIPIRSPVKMYKQAMTSKCHIDISYNVAYGPIPQGLPSYARGKPYAGVNNLCQGLFTTDFLKAALPTVPLHCEKFGISLDRVYSITNNDLFEQWRAFTGANPSEFWLLNSYLLHTRGKNDKPFDRLMSYMETSNESDRYTVAEIPEYRGGWKRTYVFRDLNRACVIPRFDVRVQRYYNTLDLTRAVSLLDIIKYLQNHKKRALFFRQVELP